MILLGIDVGGSGIKGALVETENGNLVSKRLRFDTPQPSKPEKVAKVVQQLVEQFDYDGAIGVSFPTVVYKNKAITRGNLHKSWINTDIGELFAKNTGHEYVVQNDADLAGLAEMKMGAGLGEKGMVIMVTIGTGLGTGIFYRGVLVPNVELGRIFGKDGQPIEFYAGDKARKDDNIGWKEWGDRFNYFLKHVTRVFSPDLFILGGGASKKYDKFKRQITVPVPIRIAEFKNDAGIIGAALAVENNLNHD